MTWFCPVLWLRWGLMERVTELLAERWCLGEKTTKQKQQQKQQLKLGDEQSSVKSRVISQCDTTSFDRNEMSCAVFILFWKDSNQLSQSLSSNKRHHYNRKMREAFLICYNTKHLPAPTKAALKDDKQEQVAAISSSGHLKFLPCVLFRNSILWTRG